MRNNSVKNLLEWAEEHEINLDKATLQPSYQRYSFDTHKNEETCRITFYHDRETHANMRAVKYAVRLDQKHEGDSTLYGIAPDFSPKLEIEYIGAFECTVTHHCVPKRFKDDPVSEEEQLAGESWE